MAVFWPVVLLVGVIALVLGPVLFVTAHMLLVGIVLGALGALVVFRGLLLMGRRTST